VRFVEARDLRGGPAAKETRRQADVFAATLTGDERAVRDARTRIVNAGARLEAAVDAIVG
jgi:hypothetical protein